jgi:hypothetical protein
MVRLHCPSKGYLIFLFASILVITASLSTLIIILNQVSAPIYVFQIGRDGARAPLNPKYASEFKVAAG